VVKYVPYDIKDKILPGNNEDLLMLAGEAAVFSYNESYYPEPPISNWWELTEEKWRDMTYIPNPVRSMTTLAFFSTIIDNSDLMAQAYEDLYGRPLELPPGESAGREFVRRLMDNGVVRLNSSDEVAEVIGMPGSNSPAVGIMISSKTRLREIGYELINHYDMKPFCGVYTPINVMLAGGSRNINAAKLFIRWLLGETDGTGEGYRPYLQSGAWSVRSDVQDYTGVRLDELNLLDIDRRSLYENFNDVLAFWEELLEGD
jgi:iron(III) transport system substrate-binding protein